MGNYMLDLVSRHCFDCIRWLVRNFPMAGPVATEIPYFITGGLTLVCSVNVWWVEGGRTPSKSAETGRISC